MRRCVRREALLHGLGLMAAVAGAAGSGACAPPAPPSSVAPAELYVGLARERVVAILDTVTDRVVQRISLAALGQQGHLSQIGVAPSGNAVVLPISGTARDVGLVCPAEPSPAARRAGPAGIMTGPFHGSKGAGERAGAGAALCTRVPIVGAGVAAAPASPAGFSPVGARQLAADARGHAYVVVGDALGAGPAQVAVVDLAGGRVVRRLPLADAGDRVGALAATPDGSRLFAAVYAGMWPAANASRRGQPNRIVALDTQDGRVCAATALPDGMGTVSGLAVAAAPPGSPLSPAASAPDDAAPQALYVALSNQPPRYPDVDFSSHLVRPMLLALDAEWLDTLDLWPLDRTPAGLAVLPDGRRAYALLTTTVDGPWSRELMSLDLGSGAVRRWPVASGAFALALSPVGKLYVADTLGDQLWRLDTRTDTLLMPLPLPGAPLALGCRPS